VIPAHYQGDPMAAELVRCCLPMETVDQMVERAAILEAEGVSRQEAEAQVSGGEVYS
jgi:hypothetical protein